MSTVVRVGGVVAAVVALAASGGAAIAAPGAVAPAGYEFVTRLEFGTPGAAGSRACTGVLIGPRAVLTAQSCAVTVAQPDPLDPAARWRRGMSPAGRTSAATGSAAPSRPAT